LLKKVRNDGQLKSTGIIVEIGSDNYPFHDSFLKSFQMRQGVARDGDGVVFVIFAIVTGNFHMQHASGIFAQDNGQVDVTF
jgi:hypothetical protein